ncbi:MAG: hypothetical protein IJ224_03875 [Lachnospiraceae bacterium]|nr:hypothetical protein [Lachnospiraceae bacterium]
MIALCIESSNKRGMGHLFRSLLYVEYLNKRNIDFIYLINNDEASLKILDENKIKYIIVDFEDVTSNWEKDIIEKYCINAWFNDKFETTRQMAEHICDKKIKFFVIDEAGDSDKYADVHFAGMIYPSKPNPKGKEVLCGTDYIVLNKEVDEHRKIRSGLDKILVTLGGSDPFNVTKEAACELLKYDYDVDIVIGPNYRHKEELEQLVKGRYSIYQNVESLIAMFDNYSFAITGGGFTCCEANACGLPCMIIANAEHEIYTGRYVQKLGSSIFLGKHGEWDKAAIADIPHKDIEKMSKRGLELFNTNAIDKIFEKIMDEIKK